MRNCRASGAADLSKGRVSLRKHGQVAAGRCDRTPPWGTIENRRGVERRGGVGSRRPTDGAAFFEIKKCRKALRPAALSVRCAATSPKGGGKGARLYDDAKRRRGNHLCRRDKAAAPLLIVFQFFELKNTTIFHFPFSIFNSSAPEAAAGLPVGSPAVCSG